MNWVCEDYDNFGELLESDYHAASGLLYRLGIELGDDGKPSVELPWMVDIKTPDSSNSVDDVALLIKNAIERAIDGSKISVKYKVLY